MFGPELSDQTAMPLLGHEHPEASLPVHHEAERNEPQPQLRIIPARRQSQHSVIAKTAIMSNFSMPNLDGANTPDERGKIRPEKPSSTKTLESNLAAPHPIQSTGSGACLTDTPLTTAPNSPRVSPRM